MFTYVRCQTNSVFTCLRHRRFYAFAACMLVGLLLLPATASGQDNSFGIGRRIMNWRPGFFFARTPAAPGDGRSWVGLKIMPRTPDVAIRHTDDAGRQVPGARLTDLVYTVLGEQNGWLQVRHRRFVDWFEKAQAVLVEDATGYFSERILVNKKDAFALAHRGRAWMDQDFSWAQVGRKDRDVRVPAK